ncbi:kinase-like protein, partial [Calocera cornea HHB12733]
MGLTHQPSETDIAETTEDDEATDAGALSAAADELLSGVEGKKGEKGAKRRGKGRKIRIEDFEMLRVLGKGCAGKVLLVKHRASASLYALKAITKRHVLAHQELQHTLTEQAVLKRMAAAGDQANPFVVKLYWSFHDRENLFLVMDFHPGGDLATQLARWGRLGRDRARFYAAEIVEGVEGLHAAGVIYRDLKPENILIGADGHIVLTDFGLSKEFPKRAAQPTNSLGSSLTFCGTAEYLAPEVIQGLPYSYEVDWWSFGTMLYEMLTGITPFWANNHADMYVRVLQDELMFPDDKAMDQDTKSLIRGLLQRNPALRMAEPRIKKHPYFQMIDWTHVYHKRYIPPYIPPIDPHNESDTQNFDETFL